MDDVVGAILMRQDRLLLGLRSPQRRHFPDCWDTIGGHVEAGEAPEQTLCRELNEEIGVTPIEWTEIGELIIGDIDRCRLYRVDRWSGGEPRIRDDEHVELRWFSLAEACALPNLACGDYPAIFRALKPSA